MVDVIREFLALIACGLCFAVGGGVVAVARICVVIGREQRVDRGEASDSVGDVVVSVWGMVNAVAAAAGAAAFK